MSEKAFPTSLTSVESVSRCREPLHTHQETSNLSKTLTSKVANPKALGQKQRRNVALKENSNNRNGQDPYALGIGQ
jgi:hypothetical protein